MDDPAEVDAYASAASQEHLERLDSACAEAILAWGGGEGRWLDAGCGPAQIALNVASRCRATVIGIDLSEAMLRRARREAYALGLQHRVFFVRASVERMPFKPGSLDLVYSNSLLHHLREPRSFFTEGSRLLREGGRFFLRDLVRPPRWRLRAHLRAFGRHYGGAMRQLFDASVHAAYTASELRHLLQATPLSGAEVTEEGGCYLVVRR